MIYEWQNAAAANFSETSSIKCLTRLIFSALERTLISMHRFGSFTPLIPGMYQHKHPHLRRCRPKYICMYLFRDIIYQSLTRLTANIHSLLTLWINYNKLAQLGCNSRPLHPTDVSQLGAAHSLPPC